MSATATKTIQVLDNGLVRAPGDATLKELYEAAPSRELYVEPLSASQTFSRFLAEGGVGFGSLGNGTFAGQLTEVKGRYGGKKFTYGLGKMPLYNVGYPLQRQMEGPPSELLGQLLEGRFDAPSEMVLRTREKRPVALDHVRADSLDPAALQATDGAENVLYVNAAAAKAMGLDGSGLVKVRPSDEGSGAGPGDDVWSKRFVADALPEGHARLLVLAQASGAKELADAHSAKCPDGVFTALAVHLGALVLASAPDATVKELAEKAAALPLTWVLA